MRRSLLYLSNGNVPSRWAHTVQIVKMSEALAELVPDFELVIAESLRDRVLPRIDLWDWYGVRRPFHVKRLPLWLWRSSPIFERVNEPRFSWVAPRYAARARPSLVWTRSYPIAAACLERGLPLLFERHTATASRWLPLVKRVASAPSLCGVVTLSRELCETLSKEGFPAEKLGAFPSAATPPERIGRAAARRALGIGADERVAVYSGRLSVDKGLPVLLGAARRLPHVRFVVLGGSAVEVAQWRGRAGSNVDLRGFVPNARIAEWLAAADVGLSTNSARDPLASGTSPLKIHEYVAAGLPVVASAIPAVARWLRDGETAFLFAPDDDAGLAEAIGRSLADPRGAGELAARASASGESVTWRERARRILARFAPELLSAPDREPRT